MSHETDQKTLAEQFYATMLRARRFEEEAFEFYKKGMMPGMAHLYLGEEAVAVGVCTALKPEDCIGSTHRGHGHLVARGADMGRMMAEILGKKTGYSKGKGGTMHIMARDRGILGANGIVGAELPISTGAAYAFKLRKEPRVSVVFFGDGASNQGTFHESINMAAAWDLPIVYVIENNRYAMFAVYEAASKAVERARRGEGPTLLECLTYRWQGHNVGDPGKYRPDDEVAEWKSRDPLRLLERSGILSEQEISAIRSDVEAEIADMCAFAAESEYPPLSELGTDVFVD